MSFDLKNKKTYWDKNEEIEQYEEYEEYEQENVLSQDMLMAWVGKEHEKFNVNSKTSAIMMIVLLAIISYAIYSNSPVMAITFILIGIVGYVQLNREPRIINFSITTDGIIAGREFYSFDDAKSFWLYYNPPYEKKLSLHMNGKFVPYIHIPIHNQDPVEVRNILMNFIPEKKQQRTFIDTLEALLRR